jgi:hypothetical protein
MLKLKAQNPSFRIEFLNAGIFYDIQWFDL